MIVREDGRHLALFRTLFCLGLAAYVLAEPFGFTQARLAETSALATPVRLFAFLGISSLPATLFGACRWLFPAAMLCAAAGLLVRPALVAGLGSFLLLYGTKYSLIKPPDRDVVPHATEPLFFVLVILLLAPAGKRDTVPAWPRQAVALLLTLIYLGAAYSKLSDSLLWGDGLALQSILLQKAMQTDLSAAFALAQSRLLCALLSCAVLAFQLSFCVVLFKPRLRGLYAAAGLLMHAGFLVFMGLDYLSAFGLLYLCFLQAPGARPPERGPISGPAKAALGALVALNAFCILARFDAWPLFYWRYYPRRVEIEEVAAYRVRSEFGWVGPEDFPDWGVPVSNNIAAALRSGRLDWIDAHLAAVESAMAKRGRRPGRLTVVERRVRREDGRFVIVDSELKR